MNIELLAWLFEATVATSVAVVAVLLTRRPLRRIFGIAGAYLAWLAVPASLVAVCLPALTATRAATVLAMAPMPAAMAPPAAIASANAPLPWLIASWLTGALLTLAWFYASQCRFLRALGRLRLRSDGLLQSDACAGLPAVVGWRARIVVPADFEQRFDPCERELVLCHERMHRRRGDVPASMLAALLRCLFWFNPLLHYVAAHRFRDDQELACDAAVLRRHPGRRRYGDILLKAHAGGPVPAFGTRAFGTHPLKERIHMLTRPLPSTGRWLAGAFCSLLLAGGVAFAAWAAQPASAADTMIYMDVRGAFDGGESNQIRIGQPPGDPFSFEQNQEGTGWSAEFSATPLGNDQYLVKGIVDHAGARVASPSLQVQLGREAVFELSSPDGEGRFLMGVTIRSEVAVTRDDEEDEAIRMSAIDDSGMSAAGIAGPRPVYPRSAVAAGEGGTVMLRLVVHADGRVDASEYVAEGSTVPSDSPLVASAKAAALQWTLEPAMKNGTLVDSEVLVPVRFEPSDRAPTATDG